MTRSKPVAKPKRKRPASRITVIVEEPSWREDAAALKLIRRAARLALAAPHVSAKKSKTGGIVILLTDDRHLRVLNKDFRGLDKATNVLSFPARQTANDATHLGDIALGFGVVKKESLKQKKVFAAHAAHLAAHGVLHVLGYDHEVEGDAEIMEALETRLLARLGIGDPYAKSGKGA